MRVVACVGLEGEATSHPVGPGQARACAWFWARGFFPVAQGSSWEDPPGERAGGMWPHRLWFRGPQGQAAGESSPVQTSDLTAATEATRTGWSGRSGNTGASFSFSLAAVGSILPAGTTKENRCGEPRCKAAPPTPAEALGTLTACRPDSLPRAAWSPSLASLHLCPRVATIAVTATSEDSRRLFPWLHY